MALKLEEKEETIVHNLLNLTSLLLINCSLHTSEFFRRLTYVPSRATIAQSVERRWQRFLVNVRVRVTALYVPLVLAALSEWKGHRLYLALDTTVLWDRFCMIHLSVVCCGRAVPLLWRVLERVCATVAFSEYQVMLRKARWLLRHHDDVMLLADRGNARP